MPDAISFGPIAVPPLLFSGLIALGTGSVLLKFFLPRVFPSEVVDWVASRISTALLLAFLTWKIWPLFRWWDHIRTQPVIILRLPGGFWGTVAAVIVAILFTVPGLFKHRERIKPLLVTSTITVLTFAFTVAALQSFHETSDVPQADLHAALSQMEYLGVQPSFGTEEFSKPFVVTFWATWCGPCVAELPVKAEFYRYYGSEIDYIAVNMTRSETSRSAVSQFVQNNDMRYPVALDENGRLSALFGVRGTPTTAIVDRDGTIIDRWMGASSLDRMERAVRRLD